MHDNSIIELDQSALKNNIRFLQTLFGKKVIISSVVKGNAYGHGIAEFTQMAHQCGINHFSVFDAEEAKEVFKNLGNKVTVMIMGWVSDAATEWVIENNIEFFVFEKKRLERAIRTAKKLGKPAKIHLEIETGMNRTGFDKQEWKKTIQLIQKNEKHIQLIGLCTHYAGAESIANYYRIKQQIKHFEEVYELFTQSDLKPKLRHTACSAASIMFPETRMNLLRIGIMQYGLWPSPEVFVNFINAKRSKHDPLKRVISWKSKVMSTKKVRSGDFIGYGTSYMAKDQMKIAVVPVGYAHGYSRSLSNQGRVIVNGHRCMVIGTVNMNMMIIDISGVEKVEKGDEVILIGTQDNLEVSVASFSEYSNQLNYELLTRISKSIPRKINI